MLPRILDRTAAARLLEQRKNISDTAPSHCEKETVLDAEMTGDELRTVAGAQRLAERN